MYSIKGTKDIEFNYNISSIRKISDTEYQYHGKPNSPNLVLSNGIKRISYVAERIERKQDELIIHHSATSNFPKKAIVIFPLVVSKGRITEIDRLLGMNMNETLDLDIGSEITDFTMEINETQKNAYTIRLSGGLPISEKLVIIEGACGMNAKEKVELQTALNHTKRLDNPHNTSMDPKKFNDLLNSWLETGSKCYKNGIHYVKDGNKAVSMENGNIIGAKVKSISVTSATELTEQQCSTIGGSKVIGGGIGGGGGGGGGVGVGGGISPNQEMECFPNEGDVFNKKFHIIYDKSETGEFITEDGVKILGEDISGKKNNETLRNAMNAEVKRLKEHIEKLGGVYVPRATYNGLTRINNKYNHVQSNNINSQTKKFFTNNNEIDIFITYISNNETKLRLFTGIKDNKLEGEGPLSKPHQVKECILVSVRNDNGSPILMNSKKFSEDYLNKDFNRYTHISIPGYMTDTENQSMKGIMALLSMIIVGIISYYTIPGFYKIAIQKITRNNRLCGENYENFYKAKAFNYLFVIITVIFPLIIMISTGVTNGILSAILVGGIIIVLTMLARFSNDKKFFVSFYPRNGILMCNETKDFRENQEYGSRFKVFTYMPASLSALFTG